MPGIISISIPLRSQGRVVVQTLTRGRTWKQDLLCLTSFKAYLRRCEQCEHSKAIGPTEVSGSFSPGSHRLSPIWRRYSLPNRVFSMRACLTVIVKCVVPRITVMEDSFSRAAPPHMVYLELDMVHFQRCLTCSKAMQPNSMDATQECFFPD